MWDHVGKSTSPLDHPGAARRVLAGRPLAGGVACPRSRVGDRRHRAPPFALAGAQIATRRSRASSAASPPRRAAARADPRGRPRRALSHGALSRHRRRGLHRLVDRAGAASRAATASASSTTSRRASARTWPTSPADIELIEGDIRDDGGARARRRRASRSCSTRRRSRRCRSRWPSRSRTTTSTPPGRCACSRPARQAGVRRVVYAASSAAYGDAPDAAQGRDHARRRRSRPTARRSWPASHYCQVYARAYGLETVCLRYFNVFGPRQDPKSEYAAVIPKFITAALAGQQPAHLRRRHAVARLLPHRQHRRGEPRAASAPARAASRAACSTSPAARRPISIRWSR